MTSRAGKQLLGQAPPDGPPGLEGFVRRYADAVGGTWDELEPLVYDLLLPADPDAAMSQASGAVLRVTFDPEALPEHPGAQLASFGTPLVAGMLADARRRGRVAALHAAGLDESPRDLADRLRRAVKTPDGYEVRLEGAAPLVFPQAVFWFQATFTADQKEEEIIPVAMDLHHSREVRHLDLLLDRSRLCEEPSQRLRSARHASPASVYPLARERVVRSLIPLAGARERELAEDLGRQVARMERYYADLRAEIEESPRRRTGRPEDEARARERLLAIEGEERLRTAEARRKSVLRVGLRLINLLVIRQPKVALRAALLAPGRSPGRLDLVWDPLAGAIEAADCPACSRPGFSFALDRMSRAVCFGCAQPAGARIHRGVRS